MKPQTFKKPVIDREMRLAKAATAAEAIDAFVAEHRLELRVIDEKPNASWWLRKPF